MKVFSSLYKQYLLNSLLMGVLFISTIAFADEQILPASIIKLPENENAILVEKKTQRLFLYTSNGNQVFLKFQMPCSTGEEPGEKRQEGDKKTPEGIYFLKDEYEDKYLSAIYGVKAFSTDYPNFIDKKDGKSGSAIWIHGTNKKLVPMDSNGCVALENSDILKLSGEITLNSTPVIMVETVDRAEKNVPLKREQDISLMLNQWNQAFEKGSYSEFVSFYSPGHLPDKSVWEAWSDIREKAEKNGAGLGHKMEKTGIYYQNEVAVVLFDCFLTRRSETVFLGKRKLFLEEKDNHYKIVADVFQYISEDINKTNTPLLDAAKALADCQP